MSDTSWYRKGLQFQCRGCGACCTGDPGYVWLNKAEIAAMAAGVGLDVADFEERYVRLLGIRKSLKELADGDCVLFDKGTGRCDVYAVRPRQCRTWPFWESNVRDPTAWRDACDACPGCGQGPIFSRKQIDARVAKIYV